MKNTPTLLATLAIVVPALAQDAPVPPPPPTEPAFATEAPAPDEAAAPDAPAPERPPFLRRGPGPRRDGPGPRRDGPEGRRDGPGFRRPEMAEGGRFGLLVPLLRQPDTAAKIGLSEEKAAELAQTFAEIQEQLRAARDKMPEAMKHQTEALEAAEIDEEAVLAAAGEVWDLRREVALLQTRQIVAIRKTLTADQLAKAEQLLRQAWQDSGNRRGPRDVRRSGLRPAAGPDREPPPAPDSQP